MGVWGFLGCSFPVVFIWVFFLVFFKYCFDVVFSPKPPRGASPGQWLDLVQDDLSLLFRVPQPPHINQAIKFAGFYQLESSLLPVTQRRWLLT